MNKERKSRMISFEDARKLAASLNLTSGKQWTKYWKSHDKPKDIPTHPDRAYKNKGWISSSHFFNSGYIASYKRKYRSFEDAREYARSLNLGGQTDWYKQPLPEDIPRLHRRRYSILHLQNPPKASLRLLLCLNLSNLKRSYLWPHHGS